MTSRSLIITRVENGWIVLPDQEFDPVEPQPTALVAKSTDDLIPLILAWAHASRGTRPVELPAEKPEGPVVGDIE